MSYSQDEKTKIAELLPVGIGGDIGMYSLLRDFHETYDLNSLALTAVPTRAMSDSSFITNRVTNAVSDPAALVDLILTIAAENPNRRVMVLTNSDWHVETLVRRRDQLEPAVLVPYPTLGVFEKIGEKSEFHAVCDELDIPVPRTRVIDISKLETGDIPDLNFDFDFPMFAKPSSSSQYHHASFAGKKKVYRLESRDQLENLLRILCAAQYPGEFLIQDFVPGDQRGMRSVTAYRDRAGSVGLLASGRILLEEVTPGTLGVPAAIITNPYPEIFEQAKKFLHHVGYHGYANFDVKYDPRDKTDRFFEVNPRIGRNNHYAVAAGASIARPLVDDWLLERPAHEQRPNRSVLYTVVPLALLRRQVPAESTEVTAHKRSGTVAHPLQYRRDLSPRRRLNLWANKLNHFRKFHAHGKK